MHNRLCEACSFLRRFPFPMALPPTCDDPFGSHLGCPSATVSSSLLLRFNHVTCEGSTCNELPLLHRSFFSLCRISFRETNNTQHHPTSFLLLLPPPFHHPSPHPHPHPRHQPPPTPHRSRRLGEAPGQEPRRHAAAHLASSSSSFLHPSTILRRTPTTATNPRRPLTVRVAPGKLQCKNPDVTGSPPCFLLLLLPPSLHHPTPHPHPRHPPPPPEPTTAPACGPSITDYTWLHNRLCEHP
ncbi:hypothetical protein Fmac_014848 [Flemingia macrophylla]|uniref:Uncharacterized protein n=1 Tax=Flemingia macrophylla TaxID=520843 RepID=A0ABD1MEX4_9FABA